MFHIFPFLYGVISYDLAFSVKRFTY